MLHHGRTQRFLLGFAVAVVPFGGVPAQTAADMISDGVDWLIANIDEDHWTYTMGGTDGRSGVTALCAEAILLSPGFGPGAGEEEVRSATGYIIENASGFACEGSAGAPHATIFVLRFLLRLKSVGQLDTWSGSHPQLVQDVNDRIDTLVGEIINCLSLRLTGHGLSCDCTGEEEPPCDGEAFGHIYFHHGIAGRPGVSSFLAGNALLSLSDPEIPCDLFTTQSLTAIRKAADTLACQRRSFGIHEGAFPYQDGVQLSFTCPEPPESSSQTWCKLYTIPGSISRMALCEMALLEWNSTSIANLKSAVSWFFSNQPFDGNGQQDPDDPLDKSAYGWLLSQKGTGNHFGDYKVAQWLISFAFYFTSLGIERVAAQESCAECPAWRTTMIDRLRDIREPGKSTWNDNCPVSETCGGDASVRTYPTAMAILSLLTASGLSSGDVEDVKFLRGDANADMTVDLPDAVFISQWLFLGGTKPTCEDAADSNDDGLHDTADISYVTSFLFLGGPAPPTPGPSTSGTYPLSECGLEDTPDDGVGCVCFAPCN